MLFYVQTPITTPPVMKVYDYPAHFKTVQECLAMRDLADTGYFDRFGLVYIGSDCKFEVEI